MVTFSAKNPFLISAAGPKGPNLVLSALPLLIRVFFYKCKIVKSAYLKLKCYLQLICTLDFITALFPEF